MLHYFSQKFFAPILISPYLDDKDVLNVAIVVDGIPVKEKRSVKNFTLSLVPHTKRKGSWTRALSGVLYIQLYKWKSRKPLKVWMKAYKVSIKLLYIATKRSYS